MLSVSFIGLGIMGRPMARNLLAARFPLVVHSRTASKADGLVAEGAVWADSPAEAARRSDVVITMVPDTPDVRQVLLGRDGVVAAARPGLVVIDMSTISPAATREMAAVLKETGVDMLDAPVSGGEVGAIRGTLSIMVGGDAAVFERCRPVLAAMGEKITHVGPQGHGQITKLCNQIAGVLSLQAVVEALLLATKAGVDANKVIEALSGGSADSWNLRNQGPKMLQRDFAPGFFIHLQQKDLRLALELAGQLGVPLPGAALLQQLFGVVAAHGGGNLGVQGLVRALEIMAGVEVGGKPRV
jgi:2-hydroxy-3-oxopropionate reductase